MVRFLDLVIVVEEPDQAEPAGNQQASPDIDVGEVHPEEDRHSDADQDEQSAHGRRAALGKVALRPVGTDRLPFALLGAQPANEYRPEQQPDRQCGRGRGPGAKADVTDEVEEAGETELLSYPIEHAGSFTMCSTSLASPIELDALTSTASPGRTNLASSSRASSTLLARSIVTAL